MIGINDIFFGTDQYENNAQKKSVHRTGFNENGELQKAKTDTDIIVKPDGSRVLLVTTKVCGMQTSMSLEISKPTAVQNDISEEKDTLGNRAKMSKASAAYESGYMTGIETAVNL